MKYLPILIGLLVWTNCQKPILVLDLLITNALIIDGSGSPAVLQDIGISGDSISFVGPSTLYTIVADTTIDVTGYHVAPGFIDPHTHAMDDLESPDRHANLNYLTQGVTTVFIGSDGRSATDLKTQFAIFEEQGIGTNVASYIGHGTARRLIMGMRNEAPTSDELENMKTFVRNGMEAGALGLGSGLYYAPANFSQTDEVIALAKVAAEYGGSYDVHIRDESSYNIGLIGAVEETIEVAEKAGIHANIAHIKCLGADVWGQSDQIIRLIENARSRNILITADQYPYNASGTSITGALIPRWYLAEHSEDLVPLQDHDIQQRLRADIRENIRKRGGAEKLLLTRPSDDNQDLQGMTLQEVATHWNLEPVDAAIKIFEQGGSRLGSYNMQESDIINFMKQDWVMTSSDGSTGHPRKYGSFPKKLKEYVLEKQVLSLEDFVHKSSGLTAKTFGITKRGLIKEGYFADLIIFKPDEVQDHATFEEPERVSEGMYYVLVNGEIVIDQGDFQNVMAGSVLRKSPK